MIKFHLITSKVPKQWSQQFNIQFSCNLTYGMHLLLNEENLCLSFLYLPRKIKIAIFAEVVIVRVLTHTGFHINFFFLVLGGKRLIFKLCLLVVWSQTEFLFFILFFLPVFKNKLSGRNTRPVLFQKISPTGWLTLSLSYTETAWIFRKHNVHYVPNERIVEEISSTSALYPHAR